MYARLTTVFSNLKGSKKEGDDSEDTCIRPAHSFVLVHSPPDSPISSPDNSNLSLTLQRGPIHSTPTEKLQHIPALTPIAVSPIIPKLRLSLEFDESDDSPTGSQVGLDELGPSIDG